MNENYSKGIMKILEYAKKEAQRLSHTYVGTEHFLLAILKDANGTAYDTLKSLG